MERAGNGGEAVMHGRSWETHKEHLDLHHDDKTSMSLRRIFQPSPSSKGGRQAPNDPDKSSKRKSALGVAMFALSAAKESSDAFPPLKSVMGGLTFLLKNHQVDH